MCVTVWGGVGGIHMYLCVHTCIPSACMCISVCVSKWACMYMCGGGGGKGDM